MSRPRSGGPPPDLLTQLLDLTTLPLRIAVSPLAQRAYLSTFLLFVASGTLLFLSAVAYILFYLAYVPHAAVSVPIYLQYAHPAPQTGPGSIPVARAASHPFGTALLAPSLSAYQRYDVEVVLDLPTSPVNRRAGNFMVEIALLAPVGMTTASSSRSAAGGEGDGGVAVDDRGRDRAAQAAAQHTGGRFGDSVVTEGIDEIAQASVVEREAVVVRARRPALLRYTSGQVDVLRMAAGLPWYALGWADEREEVVVGMLEDVEFAPPPRSRKLRGGVPGVPDRVRVTVEARELLEVYAARVEIRARLSGLRWLMYRHKVFSFVVFTGGFFAATMGSAIAVFVTLTIRQIMREDAELEMTGHKVIKEEEEEGGVVPAPSEAEDDGLSDTSRQFPTGYGKEPLKYSGRGRQMSRDGDVRIKEEEEEDADALVKLSPADDEDDGDDYEDAGAESFRDSGIGTGREERESAAARRRKRTSAGGDGVEWDGRGRLPGL